MSGGRISSRRNSEWENEAKYDCEACGEEIVVPVDLSAGASQEYVEHRHVYCRPNVIHVEIEGNGEVRVRAEKEQEDE